MFTSIKNRKLALTRLRLMNMPETYAPADNGNRVFRPKPTGRFAPAL